MRIIDILNQKDVTLSFEVFPPKTDSGYSSVASATESIAALKPDFMSVTYGAGGGTSKNTLNIAANLREKYGTEVLPHLTCVSSDKEQIRQIAGILQSEGFENIMALRGDIPKDGSIGTDYHYASELIYDLKQYGDFCIGAACYPEGHVESENKNEDIGHLKEKVDAGCDFLTTQMFFDNSILYNFLYRIRSIGIQIPVIAGIMPITNVKQVARTVQMSGTALPSRFLSIVDRFGNNPEAMQQAGIVYACEQIIDLIANDVAHIHVYTMNKPEVAEGIMRQLSHII